MRTTERRSAQASRRNRSQAGSSCAERGGCTGGSRSSRASGRSSTPSSAWSSFTEMPATST
jgi:hypothetical protein